MNSKSAVKTSLVATGAAALVLGFAGAAGAQTYPDPQPASPVEETDVQAVPLTPADTGDGSGDAGSTATQATAVAVQQQQQLPVTGGDAAAIAIFGSILVAGGGLLVWRSKGEELEA